jgi:thioredoxin 1
MKMSLPVVDVSSFDQAIQTNKLTFVDFSAKWCPPCKVLHPILEELQQEEGDRVSIAYVDCDESPELSSRFGVMSMPTVILFNNGEPVEKLIGLRPKEVYRTLLGRYAN